LPFYMVPSTIKIMEAMPLTPNRKIDRKALPFPEKSIIEDDYLAPRNDTEFRMAALWKEVLEVERIGVRDNFFSLGGHSLLAVRLFARIEEEFGRSLPLLLMFKDGTVEALSKALDHQENSEVDLPVIPIQPGGRKPPLFVVLPGIGMRDLALELGTDQPIFGLNPVENGKMVFRISVQETAELIFRELVNFRPTGPYLLMGHSAFGYFAVEL